MMMHQHQQHQQLDVAKASLAARPGAARLDQAAVASAQPQPQPPGALPPPLHMQHPLVQHLGDGLAALTRGVQSGVQQQSAAPPPPPRAALVSSETTLLGAPGPITPAQALKRYADYLTPLEQSEILQYPQVWFLGAPGAAKVKGDPRLARTANYGYDDERGDYLVRDGDHVAYR